MKVEKEIIRQSFDYKAEAAYYEEARICPNCGHKRSDDKTRIELSPIEQYIKKGRQYTCLHCGCQWQVKEYKEKK